MTDTFQRQLFDKGACREGREWARLNHVTDAEDAWARLPRADWMLWLADNFGFDLDEDLLQQLYYEAANRAVHIHAVGALRSAGLTAAADRLDAVAPITDELTAKAAAARARAIWTDMATDADGTAPWTAVEAVVEAAYAARAADGDYASDAIIAADRSWGAERLRAIFPTVGATAERPAEGVAS